MELELVFVLLLLGLVHMAILNIKHQKIGIDITIFGQYSQNHVTIQRFKFFYSSLKIMPNF